MIFSIPTLESWERTFVEAAMFDEEEVDHSPQTLAKAIKEVLGFEYKPVKKGKNDVSDENGRGTLGVDTAGSERGKRENAGDVADGESASQGTRGDERGGGTEGVLGEERQSVATGTGLEPSGKDPLDSNEDTPEEVAMRARISVGDEWEEEGPDAGHPIYPTIASINDYIKYKNEILNEEIGKLPDWLRPAAVNSDYAEYPEIGAVSPEEYQRYLTEAEKMPPLTMSDVAPQLKKGIPLTAEQHKQLRKSERIQGVRAAKSFIKRAMNRRKAEDEQEYDNQGNPIDEWGDLVVEQVESVNAITDKDFTEPCRTVGLPPLPEKVANAIGIGERGPIIKKNVFEKNLKHHKELTPEDGRLILSQTLYNPQLYGQNLKTQRPYNWILVHLADRSSAVVVEVNNPDKDNSEIVNWHYIGGEELERKKRQAVKEGGLILTLSEDNAAAYTHDDLLSDGKGNALSAEKQTSAAESSEGYTITSTTYTNKAKHTSDVFELAFDKELTDEQAKAVKAIAMEPVGESKSRFSKKRGWQNDKGDNRVWTFHNHADAERASMLYSKRINIFNTSVNIHIQLFSIYRPLK